MDNKNKIFFAVFFTLIGAVVIVAFAKYFIAKDYYIVAQADCDPYSQKCFIWECDPESDAEGEKCTGDPEKDIWYYQNVKKIANQIPLCDPNNEDCDALSCELGMDCEVGYCEEDDPEEKIECNNPVKYAEENPIEGEEECAEDDAECLEEIESECAEDDEECTSDEKEEENAEENVKKEKSEAVDEDKIS